MSFRWRASTLPALVLPLALTSCGAEPGKFSSRLYVTNETSGDLTVIDPDTRKVIGTIAVGKRPRGVVASPDGKFLYIALSGSPVGGPGVDESTLPPPDKSADGIAVFDVAAGKVLKVLRGVSDPETIAVSPDGKTLYVASEDTGQLIVMDAGTGKITTTVPAGGEAEGTAVSPDGSLVYVTSEADQVVAVYDVAGKRVRARIKVGIRPRNAVFTADGKRAFVPGEADASITAIDVMADRAAGRAQLDPSNRPMGVALTAGDKHLLATTGRGGQLVRLDPATLKLTGQVKVGQRPWGLALSKDSKIAFTANGPSNDVAMVDVETMKVLATIPAGNRPWGAAIISVPGRQD